MANWKPEDFPKCGHPELMPTRWEQKKPSPARMIGDCPQHNAVCPICGWGWGSIPQCGCKPLKAE